MTQATTIRRNLHLTALLSSTLILAACGGGGAPAEEEAIGDPAKGRQIYDTGGAAGVPCASCHTLDGIELVGPSFQGLGERAGTREEGVSDVDYLRQSITEPQAFVVPGFEDAAPMPTLFADLLSEDDVNNVIAFLLTQK